MSNELIDITVQKLHETDKAVLVTDSVAENAVWLPKSQIEIEENTVRGLYIVTLPEWLAKNRGLI